MSERTVHETPRTPTPTNAPSHLVVVVSPLTAGMSYMTRTDLPFYYTLYDNWVAGDHYHQSTFTCTNPNRMHLFTGSNGLSVGENAVIDNTEPNPGYSWITMGEVLEAANVSWKVYQQVRPGIREHDVWMDLVDGEVCFAGLALASALTPYIASPSDRYPTATPTAGRQLRRQRLRVV